MMIRTLFWFALLPLILTGLSAKALDSFVEGLPVSPGAVPAETGQGKVAMREVLATPPERVGPFANVLGRERLELSGPWQYIVDPMRAGFRGSGWRRSLWRESHPPAGELTEYDWNTSPYLRVPGDWNSQVEELKWYTGTVWLRRLFEAEPEDARRYFLYFEAVNYEAVVHLNGKRVGTHEGGFTPFAIEVTGQLESGSNSVVVAVDSTSNAETVPALNVDWWNYGGITRPVHLVSVPETFIHDYVVGLGGEGTIGVSVVLDGPAAAGALVSVEIAELGMSAEATADRSGTVELSVEAEGVGLWSPEDPRLYTVSVRSGSDLVTEQIGFRRVEVSGNELLLNGEPVFLRGISIHEEPISIVGTRSMSWAQARALLAEAKELGANFVRLSHYPHSERMTRLADEMGLLVWSEIPVYWDVDYESPLVLQRARAMLSEMITRDKNRASVIIWSVANETPTVEARTRFLRRLIDDARFLDPTRLVSAALHATFEASVGTNTVMVDDPLGEYIDLIAFNRYEGWYGPRTPAEIDEVRWETVFDKPMILSEFGADALFGMRGDRFERYTEEYQAFVYEESLEMAGRIPNLVGTSPWILKDFRSGMRYHGDYQDYWNRKGLVDPSGQRKLAFDVLRDWYRAKAEADASAE